MKPCRTSFTINLPDKFFGIEQTPGFKCDKCGHAEFDVAVTDRLTAKANELMKEVGGFAYVCQYKDMLKKNPFAIADDDEG